MKLSLNAAEVKSLVEKYYERKNKKVDVALKSSIRSVGYYENSAAYGEILITRNIEILGVKTKTEDILSQDEVLGIFNELLASEGYCVTNLNYDVGINQGGSYIWESNTPSAYCCGIELDVEKIQKITKELKA